MANENATKTDGALDAGSFPDHLANVDMNHPTNRLGALSSIIGGMDHEGNDLPPGERRQPEGEPGQSEDAPSRERDDKGRFRARDRQEAQEGGDSEGEADPVDDVGDQDGDEDIPADAGNAPDDQGSAGDEDAQIESFEAMMEAAGIDADTASDLMFDVVIGGETQQIPYKDLVQGYRRQQDLTRGFQEVSEAKRKTAEIHEAVATKYREGVQALAASLRTLDAQMVFDQAQIERIRATNPEAASAALARNERNRQVYGQQLEAIQEAYARQAEAEEQAQAARQEYTRDMLLSRHPKLRTEEGRTGFQKDLEGFLEKRGFSAEDMNLATQDWRIVEIVMDAMEHGKAKAMKQSIDGKTVKRTPKRVVKNKRASTAKATDGQRNQALEAERAQAIRSGQRGALAGFLVDSGMVKS